MEIDRLKTKLARCPATDWKLWIPQWLTARQRKTGPHRSSARYFGGTGAVGASAIEPNPSPAEIGIVERGLFVFEKSPWLARTLPISQIFLLRRTGPGPRRRGRPCHVAPVVHQRRCGFPRRCAEGLGTRLMHAAEAEAQAAIRSLG